jgi:hypothetical protein
MQSELMSRLDVEHPELVTEQSSIARAP